MSETVKNREIGMECMRVFCIFLVIIIHSSGYVYNTHTTSQISWYISETFAQLGMFAVPVLFMLSGYFLLDENKELPLKKLYFKNILRLEVALISWSVIYAVFDMVMWRQLAFTKSNILRVAKLTLDGQPHFWFISTLLCIYVLLPVIREVVKNKTVMEYYIILFLVIKFTLPYFVYVPDLYKIITRFGINDFSKTASFSLYFILGYYLKVNPIKKNNYKWLYTLGLIAIISNPIVTAVVSYVKQVKFKDMENYQSIIVFIAAVSVFTFFSSIKINNLSIKKIVILLSSTSFGIYLIHMLVILILTQLGIYSLGLPAIFLIPLVAISAFCSGFFIIYIIKQIPFISKYIT